MTMPQMRVPATARQRRRRNNRHVHFPTAALKRVVLSARWISLFLLLITAGALALIGLDEHFYVTFIPVEGVTAVPAEEIVAASGLAGAHVFAVDPEQAAAAIAELPGVISATVTISWPNSVSIRLREEAPVALWVQDGRDYWISKAGNLLPARMALEGLIVIQAEGVMDTPPVVAGPGRDTTTTSADESVPLLFVPPDLLEGAMQLTQLRPNLTNFYYDPSGGLSFDDGQGWRAYFGTGSDMARKMVVYETILSDLRSRNLTPVYISVSNQDKPYYRVVEQELDQEPGQPPVLEEGG